MTSPTDALPRWKRKSMICRSLRLKPVSSSSCAIVSFDSGYAFAANGELLQI